MNQNAYFSFYGQAAFLLAFGGLISAFISSSFWRVWFIGFSIFIAAMLRCLNPKSNNLSEEKRSPEKRASIFRRFFASFQTPEKTPTTNIGDYESDGSDYQSGDDDDAFPTIDNIPEAERTYSLNKNNLSGTSEFFSRELNQAPRSERIPGCSPRQVLPEQSPPVTMRAKRMLQRSSGSGRTESTHDFAEEFDLSSDEEGELIFSEESDSEDKQFRFQKRMLISFKEERERCVVWNTVSIESLPNSYVFNAGDVVYLEDGKTVAKILQMFDEGQKYRVQIRDSGEVRDVPFRELEHCIKIIVKHPTEEQIEFFETCDNEPSPNFLSTASSSFCCSPRKTTQGTNHLAVPS